MKILIEFAHPALQKSRINKQMINTVQGLEGIFVNDLYETYPDFGIDVKKEQQLLVEHDLVVFQHPFYWYSSPALLKEWQDLVLEHNFAYGSEGTSLSGKYMFSAISTGGNDASYKPGGYNRYRVIDMLIPFRQTAALCGMTYLPPFLVQGTHMLNGEQEIGRYSSQYKKLLVSIRDRKLNLDDLTELESLNEIL